MSDKKKKLVSFSVNLPEDLNEKVERDAAIEMRSKNLQINWIVAKYYDSMEAETATATAGRTVNV